MGSCIIRARVEGTGTCCSEGGRKHCWADYHHTDSSSTIFFCVTRTNLAFCVCNTSYTFVAISKSDLFWLPYSLLIVCFWHLAVNVIKLSRVTTFIMLAVFAAGQGSHFFEVRSLPRVPAGFKTLRRGQFEPFLNVEAGRVEPEAFEVEKRKSVFDGASASELLGVSSGGCCRLPG